MSVKMLIATHCAVDPSFRSPHRRGSAGEGDNAAAHPKSVTTGRAAVQWRGITTMRSTVKRRTLMLLHGGRVSSDVGHN